MTKSGHAPLQFFIDVKREKSDDWRSPDTGRADAGSLLLMLMPDWRCNRSRLMQGLNMLLRRKAMRHRIFE